ncbi:hypothetical protein MQE36_15925 [Zhouia spongiae]|uniref:ROK family protein n=1 Tax=Zhouia spongiae TaxID=2202721 RepID=A0ABY3YLA2_9FLAO|nr:hypothetical protein [Zhouia spongiae]UNY98555.1 hypothetical protein MQE36_15925 [Zhouia spongiae]
MINQQTCYLAIDIGGSRIKACWMQTDETFFTKEYLNKLINNHIRLKSCLNENTSIEELVSLVKKVMIKLGIRDYLIKGVGISTAGIVNYL